MPHTRESTASRQLSDEAAHFFRRAYAPARAGCLNELRQAGCTEEEAEDIFASTFERVMQTVDPIGRQFAVPQMVNLLKTSCRRKLIDERRHQGVLHKVPLAEARALSDDVSETPGEVAELHEAVEMGREAIAELSDRDRQVFVQRHQLGLAPEEIIESVPGLSRRAYRKIMQRANARVLKAFEEIDSGERCRDMVRNRLQRYVLSEGPSGEARAVEAHLHHCRACQKTVIELRGYLHDIASGVVVMAAGSGEIEKHGHLLADAVGRVVDAGQTLGEAGRAARERLRDQAIRAATSMPGSGGDAAAGQALGISGAKLAGACAAGAAGVATCVALGVSPLGVVGVQQERQADPPAAEVKAEEPPTTAPEYVPAPPTEETPPPADPPPSSTPEESTQEPSAEAPQEPNRVRPASESGEQTGNEFQPSGTPVKPSAPPPSESSGAEESPPAVSSGSTVGGSSAPESGGGGGGGGSPPADGGANVGL